MTADYDGDAPNVFTSIGDEAGERTARKGRKFMESANHTNH